MKYTVNGKPATAEQAEQHWYASKSYAMANRATRHRIWRDAHASDGGRWGEINWLNEAGVEIIKEPK